MFVPGKRVEEILREARGRDLLAEITATMPKQVRVYVLEVPSEKLAYQRS